MNEIVRTESADLTTFLNHMESEVVKTHTEAMEKIKQDMTDVISQLFENCEGLNSIHICGYTPGFNDGDPCYHSSNAVVIYECEEFERYGFDWGEGYFLHDIYDEDDVKDGSFPVNYITSDEATAIENFFNSDPIEQVLEQIYDTNWIIEFRRESDGISQTVHEYDCGH